MIHMPDATSNASATPSLNPSPTRVVPEVRAAVPPSVRSARPGRYLLGAFFLQTWREARAGRWLLVLIGLVVASAAAGLFARSLALTEAGATGEALAAWLARLMGVGAVCAFVATQVSREFTSRTVHIVLAGPVSRTSWLLARFASLAVYVVSATLACAAGLAVAKLGAGTEQAPADALLPIAGWGLVLAFELAMMSAVALSVAVAFREPAPTLLACAAFYVLARTIGVLALLAARGPLSESAAGQFASGFLHSLSMLLPNMSLFAEHAPGAGSIGLAAAQACALCAVMLCAAAFDLRRKDL